MATGIQKPGPGEDPSMLARFLIPILLFSRKPLSMSEFACSRRLTRPKAASDRLLRLVIVLRMISTLPGSLSNPNHDDV